MKKILFLLSLFISAFSYSQNISENKLAGPPKVFNVMKYGAVGDGVTNDGPAIKLAIAEARKIKGLGVIYFPLTPSNIYQVNDVIDSTYGGYDCNCQIPIPVDSGDANRGRIVFRGEVGPSMTITGGTSTGTPTFSGVTIRSGYAGNRSTRVVGTAIIGTNGPNLGGVGNGENLNYLTVENLAFIVKNNPNGAGPEIGGVNYRHGSSVTIRNCTYSVDTAGSITTLPTRDISGFETSDCNNEADNTLENVLSLGAKYGFIIGEHTTGSGQLQAFFNYYGYGFKWGNHASVIGKALAQWCVNGITYVDQGSGCNVTPLAAVRFNVFDIEGSASCYPGKWFNLVNCVNDSNNRITGNIGYWMSNCGTGGNGTASWVVNGATNFRQVALGVAGDNTSITSPTIYGGTASGGNIALQSTSNATKGKIYFGPSANNNYFNQAFGNLVLNQSAATNYSFASYQSDLTGGGALFPGLILVNTNASSPGGGQYNLAMTTLGAGNSAVVGQFAASYGTGATAPFTTQGFVAGTRTNDPMIFFQNSNQIARIDATGFNPYTTAAFDLGTASLVWRDLYLSHPIGKTTIGASSSLGTNVTSVTPAGNDAHFKLTVVTSATATGTIGLVAFGRTWGATPICVVSSADAATGAMIASAGGYVALTATSATSMTLVGLFTGAGTWVFNCHCGQ